MTYRRHSVIYQPPLPGVADPDAYQAFRRQRREPGLRKPRITAADRRLQAARTDPRQRSIFGPGHTDELTGW